MPNTTRDSSQDEQIVPLLKHADENLGQWCVFITDDPRILRRVVDWMVYSKNSPFDWCPAGKRGTGGARTYALEWARPDGTFTRDLAADGVYRESGRVGRIKLRMSHAEQQRQEEQTTP